MSGVTCMLPITQRAVSLDSRRSAPLSTSSRVSDVTCAQMPVSAL